MNTHIRNAFITMLCILCTPIWLQAQTLRGHIESAGAYYRLIYTINSSEDGSFTAPNLPDFEILSPPQTSKMSSYQIVNGRASHAESTTYTLVLSARKTGTVSIGPASVKINGHIIQSNSIKAKVSKSSNSTRSNSISSSSTASGAQLQQAGSPVTQKDLFIDVVPSRTVIYEQEAVLLTYRIHSRLGVGLYNTGLVSKPDFKDFISQEIPLPNNQIQTSIEHTKSGTYKTGTLLRYVVFPQRSGKIKVPSITFNCTVVQQDNTLDLADAFFNGGGRIGIDVKRTVPELELTVNPLPQPKPQGFTGAVGHLKIEGKLLNSTLRTNEVATYRITISGTGNMKLIAAPQVDFPKDFDHYAPKTNDNTQISANGQTGSISFDYTIVPRNVGKYEIPSTAVSYFDPQTQRYITLLTQALTFDVVQGSRSNDDIDRQLQLLHSDIHPQRDASRLSQKPSIDFGTKSAFIPYALLLLAFSAAFFTLKKLEKRNADVTGRRMKEAEKVSMQLLEQAHACASNSDSHEFYSLIAKAIDTYLKNKFNIETTQLTKENIRQTLQEKGVPAESAEKFIQTLSLCEQARYAPIPAEMGRDVYNETVQSIKTIEQCAKR